MNARGSLDDDLRLGDECQEVREAIERLAEQAAKRRPVPGIAGPIALDGGARAEFDAIDANVHNGEIYVEFKINVSCIKTRINACGEDVVAQLNRLHLVLADTEKKIGLP